MRPYVEKVYGWDDALQKEVFDKEFTPNTIKIIRLEGKDVGMFEVEESELKSILIIKVEGLAVR